MHDEGVANASNFLDKLPAAMRRPSWSSPLVFELALYASCPSPFGKSAPPSFA